jgi:uncharacterized membrane protein YjjB (DUF3815 family)
MTTPDPIVDAQSTGNSDQALIAHAAALLHANGESTAVTLDAVDRLNRGLATDFQVVPGWTSIVVLDKGRDPLTIIAPPEGVTMRAVAIAMRAVDKIAEKNTDQTDLAAELDRASKAGQSPLWQFVLACATGSAALSIIFGAADATAVLLVALSGALGGLIRRHLGKAHIGPIGQLFAAAFLAGTIGGIAVNADLSTSVRLIAVCPALILVPGPHILNGFLDVFDLRISLGFARLGYAAVLVLSIGAGLALALAIFGTDLPVEPAGRIIPLWLDVAAAAVAAASYAIYFAIPNRLIFWPIVVGAIAHGFRTWTLDDLGWNVAVGATLACLVVGIVLAPVSHRFHIPFAAVSFAAVVALIPGVYLLRAIDALGELPFRGSESGLLGAISDGTTAALIVAGMAVGLALPKYLFRQVISRREKTA